MIGVADPMKGQVPRGFVVLKAGVERDEDAAARRAGAARARPGRRGGRAADVAVVAALPKTRSGKILRKTMRGIADGADEPVPSTIDDAGVLDALRPVLRRRREANGGHRAAGRTNFGSGELRRVTGRSRPEMSGTAAAPRSGLGPSERSVSHDPPAGRGSPRSPLW